MDIREYLARGKCYFSLRKYFAKNVLRTNHNKTAIFSYLTRPFIASISNRHSNLIEAREIAHILDELGYNVDVVQYNSPFEKLKGLPDKCDLLFGVEPNYIDLVAKYPSAKKIYYGTGANCRFQNQAEEARILDVQKRKGTKLLRRRKVLDHRASNISDAVILIGNKWTKSTYAGKAKQVELVNVSAVPVSDVKKLLSDKNFSQAKKSFLWFGSVGAVHKGLDLLLDVFASRPELQLYICGAVENELDFVSLYKKELYETENIHLVGWVDAKSKKFQSIINSCAYTILPSCSEGMSSSVATCMMAGLIPVISEETGVDMNGIGIAINDLSPGGVSKAIDQASKLSTSEVKRRSSESLHLAEKEFGIENFSNMMSRALKKLL